MKGSEKLEIDGKKVIPLSLRFYEELVDIELNNDMATSVFPVKSIPRYQFVQDGLALGYFKVSRAKALSNKSTTKFTLHRQC